MDFRESWNDEAVQEAVVLLQDLVLWELSPQRWDNVERILSRIAQAMTDRDLRALHDATAELELSGPVRVLRIGSKESTGIPPMILDRRNQLIHSLTEKPARDDEAETAPEYDRGPQQQPR